MSSENMKPQEQLTLEPYERDHAVVVGIYRYTYVLSKGIRGVRQVGGNKVFVRKRRGFKPMLRCFI